VRALKHIGANNLGIQNDNEQAEDISEFFFGSYSHIIKVNNPGHKGQALISPQRAGVCRSKTNGIMEFDYGKAYDLCSGPEDRVFGVRTVP
jgi:hypothetical protein